MPSVKAAEVIAESLARLYPGAVDVHYYDLADPVLGADYAAELAALTDRPLPPPIALLDGELLSAGALQPLRTVGAVATVLHQRNAASVASDPA